MKIRAVLAARLIVDQEWRRALLVLPAEARRRVLVALQADRELEQDPSLQHQFSEEEIAQNEEILERAQDV